MGHFHSENLSRILLDKLFDKWFNNPKEPDKPRENLETAIPDWLEIDELVSFITEKIKLVKNAIAQVIDEEAKKEILSLMQEKYCNSASEGYYDDDGMIEDGLLEIIYYMKQDGNLEIEDDKRVRFTQKAIDQILKEEHGLGLEKLIIKEIEM